MKSTPTQKFVQTIEQRLEDGQKDNRVSSQKIAAEFGITDKKTVKELTELAICNVARRMASQPMSIYKRFEQIKALYDRQTSMSFRDSETVMLQQYSTPVPMAYLMGVWAGIDRPTRENRDAKFFEPSAGNGLLTIACSDPKLFTVNELSEKRLDNLRTQFDKVYAKDASKRSFTADFKEQFDAVITNPPFGRMSKEVFHQISVTQLASWMMLLALETMRNDGKAAIIIGGHTNYDDYGRIKMGETRTSGDRVTFNYLYANYHVADIINVSGELYARQGQSSNIRIILIDGRKKEPDKNFAPLKQNAQADPVTTYEALFDRIMGTWNTAIVNHKEVTLQNQAIALKDVFNREVKLALANQ